MADAAARRGGLPYRAVAVPALEAVRRRPRGHARDGRPGGRRAAARLRAQAQLLRSRRRHRAVRRHPAPALRASRGRRRHPDLGQGARLLRRRQHPHARPVVARLEGELLQVHQRDAQRDRGGHRGVAAGLRVRGQRPLRGRRLRAGPGLRPHRDGRRRQHHGRPARGAAARRAAGHRRAHPARGQAPRAPRPRRLLLHPRGRHQGQAGGRVGAGGRGGAALAARGDGAGSAPPSSPRGATGRPTGAASRCRRSSGRSRATASPTGTSRARSTARAASPRSPWRRPASPPPPASPPACTPQGGGLLAAGAWPASSTT